MRWRGILLLRICAAFLIIISKISKEMKAFISKISTEMSSDSRTEIEYSIGMVLVSDKLVSSDTRAYR